MSAHLLLHIHGLLNTLSRKSSALLGSRALLGLLVVGCGSPYINPPHNLARPSDVVIVGETPVTDTSAEYAFVLDTERAQVVVLDVTNGLLTDLHPDVPGYNGVFLGGQPSALAARADGTEVVVANFGQGTLQVICTPVAKTACPTTRLVATIDVGDAPERVAVVGAFAFVSRPRAGVVVKVDLSTRQVVGFYEVGGAPRGLQGSQSGQKVYVADSAGDAIHRITIATGEVSRITVGAPTEAIFVSPNPEWVYALSADSGSLFVVNPATEQRENIFPDGPPGAGPDLSLPGRITGMAFQTFSAAEALPIGYGQIAFVTAADGVVYMLNTDGATPHQLVNRAPPGTDGGASDCDTVQWALDAGEQQNACPSIQITPQLSFLGTALAVTADVPVVLGYAVSPRYGIRFGSGRRVVRTEAWNITYEGAITGLAPTRATLSANNVLTNVDVRFPEVLVPGTTSDYVLRNGDFVVFTEPPQARAGVDCSKIDLETAGDARRWRLTLNPAKPNELALAPEDGTALPPLTDCYTQTSVSYDIRVKGAWAVQGSTSGFQGRAGECPRSVPEGSCEAFTYRSPFFSMILRQGLTNSYSDLRWTFQANDGVTAGLVSLNVTSSLAGLPRAIAGSRHTTRMLLVVDESDESVFFVNPLIPQIDRTLR